MAEVGRWHKTVNFAAKARRRFKSCPSSLIMVNEKQIYWCNLCQCAAIRCSACENSSCNAGNCEVCRDIFTKWNHNPANFLLKKEEVIHTEYDLRRLHFRPRVRKFVDQHLSSFQMRCAADKDVDSVTDRIMDIFDEY